MTAQQAQQYLSYAAEAAAPATTWRLPKTTMDNTLSERRAHPTAGLTSTQQPVREATYARWIKSCKTIQQMYDKSPGSTRYFDAPRVGAGE